MEELKHQDGQVKSEEDSGSLSWEEKQEEPSVVLAAITEVSAKLDALNQLFSEKIQRTSYEEDIFNRMHAELQKYKDDLYAQLLRPVLQDIIEVRESIRRISENFASKPEEERMVPLKTFSDYMFDMGDILEKNQIHIFDSKQGEDFQPLKQRAVKQIFTPVEEEHGKIALSLSSGYEYLGNIFSPEKVAVYIYRKDENTEGEENNG